MEFKPAKRTPYITTITGAKDLAAFCKRAGVTTEVQIYATQVLYAKIGHLTITNHLTGERCIASRGSSYLEECAM